MSRSRRPSGADGLAAGRGCQGAALRRRRDHEIEQGGFGVGSHGQRDGAGADLRQHQLGEEAGISGGVAEAGGRAGARHLAHGAIGVGHELGLELSDGEGVAIEGELGAPAGPDLRQRRCRPGGHPLVHAAAAKGSEGAQERDREAGTGHGHGNPVLAKQVGRRARAYGFPAARGRAGHPETPRGPRLARLAPGALISCLPVPGRPR